MDERNPRDECHSCKHKRTVPGNTHISCINPDLTMTAEQHGIENGWFIYPVLFDPVWKTKLCNNYKLKD